MQGPCGGLVPIHRRQRGGKNPWLSYQKFEVRKAGAVNWYKAGQPPCRDGGEEAAAPGEKEAGSRGCASLGAQNLGLTHLPPPDLVSQALHLLTLNAICVPVTSASLTRHSRCLCCSGVPGWLS